MTFDYAPDGAWLELVGACLTAEAPQFNYEICLFDKAQQVGPAAPTHAPKLCGAIVQGGLSCPLG